MREKQASTTTSYFLGTDIIRTLGNVAERSGDVRSLAFWNVVEVSPGASKKVVLQAIISISDGPHVEEIVVQATQSSHKFHTSSS